MTDHWTELTRFGIALFALLSPFTAIPYVLHAAGAAGVRATATLAAAASTTAMLVLLAMHWLGEQVLVTLGTSLPSFQIGGGLIILLSGLSMLRDEPAGQITTASAVALKSILKTGVAPLGIPMLAGTGAITKVIIESHRGYGIEDETVLAAIIVGNCVLAGLILAGSGFLARVLGATFFSIFGRISGLVIVAVAVEMMVKGLAVHVRQFAAG
jgi:multiple antibiotic resistance protein